MKARGNRNAMTDHHQGRLGDGAGQEGPVGALYRGGGRSVAEAARQIETIDLYLSHWPDDATPHAETLGAYQRLIAKGKIRCCGASNFTAAQLAAALAASQRARPAALRGPAARIQSLRSQRRSKGRCAISASPRRSASSPITASPKDSWPASTARRPISARARAAAACSGYLNPRGLRILDALAAVAARHGAKPAEVALAWLIAQPGVTAPIASATSLAQVDSLIRAATLTLSADDLAALDSAAAPAA